MGQNCSPAHPLPSFFNVILKHWTSQIPEKWFYIPSSEVTYPTFGTGASSSKVSWEKWYVSSQQSRSWDHFSGGLQQFALEKPPCHHRKPQLLYRNDEMGPLAYISTAWEAVPYKSPEARRCWKLGAKWLIATYSSRRFGVGLFTQIVVVICKRGKCPPKMPESFRFI